MKVKIWLALLTLYLVWGSTYLAMRFAVESIPPFLSAGTRFLLAGSLFLVWQRVQGEAMPTPRQWLSLAVIGNLLLLGGNGLVSWAVQTVPSGVAALVIAATPLFMVVIEAFRPGGARPNRWTFLGLALGFLGMMILVDPVDLTATPAAPLNPLGMMALLLAGIFWSLGSVYSKHADLPRSSLVFTGGQMVMGSLGLFLTSLVSGEWQAWSADQVSFRSAWSMVYLIFIGALAGFGAYGWLLQHASISLVATYAYVNPIVAIVLGYVLGNEALELRLWLATAFIVGSVMFIHRSQAYAAQTKDMHDKREVVAVER